ncbi:DUF378 domain-containing protein [Oceanobacillus sp. FSL H7-0719]|uniref:DUF378 domain-containing protein n=1 Tax=Oceanobacillus sp. FSL H7-0719 TaxID=2954507 RepID=UPI0032535CC0
MHTLRRVALAFVIIGAINWGLIALFQFDLVASIFGGQDSAISRIIYAVVGLSGLICLSFYYDPETDARLDNNRDITNSASFGTEFADEIDPEYRVDKDDNTPRE